MLCSRFGYQQLPLPICLYLKYTSFDAKSWGSIVTYNREKYWNLFIFSSTDRIRVKIGLLLRLLECHGFKLMIHFHSFDFLNFYLLLFLDLVHFFNPLTSSWSNIVIFLLEFRWSWEWSLSFIAERIILNLQCFQTFIVDLRKFHDVILKGTFPYFESMGSGTDVSSVVFELDATNTTFVLI